MKNKSLYLSVVVAILFMALAAFSLLSISTPTQAAPPAAPTPLANFIVDGVQPAAFTLQAATALTTDTNTAAVDVLRLGAIYLQYVVDQGTVNTATLTIQYSNDNLNWFNGVPIVSANAADATDGVILPLGWRWVRVNQDLTNSNPLTITLLAVGR